MCMNDLINFLKPTVCPQQLSTNQCLVTTFSKGQINFLKSTVLPQCAVFLCLSFKFFKVTDQSRRASQDGGGSAAPIVRSHMILSSSGTLSTTKAATRSSLMLEASVAFESNQMKHRSRMGSESYTAMLKEIRRNVHEDHYKVERISQLKKNVNDHQEANKKLNAIQKGSSGVDRTVATLGLIAYSSINKNKGHEAPLKEELLYRKVHFIEGAGFMELKKSLMEHEVKRATTQESINTAKKAFTRLSNAIFLGVDIDRVNLAGNEFTLAEDVDEGSSTHEDVE